jgi:hypothetical protein
MAAVAVADAGADGTSAVLLGPATGVGAPLTGASPELRCAAWRLSGGLWLPPLGGAWPCHGEAGGPAP